MFTRCFTIVPATDTQASVLAGLKVIPLQIVYVAQGIKLVTEHVRVDLGSKLAR